MVKRNFSDIQIILGIIAILLTLSACNSGMSEEEMQATIVAGVEGTASALSTVDAAVAETVAANSAAQVLAEVSSTWTAVPTEAATETPLPPPATSTPIPTATQELPTNTPVPTDTPVPTETAVPQNTAPPPPPPQPAELTFGPDILPNGSFEDGWYNKNNAPELQLPNGYGFESDSGPTGFGTEEWDKWYTPETRVWPDYQIPPHEQSLFLQDGQYTLKMFKGNGPISFRFFIDLPLDAGTYLFRVRTYPDMVMGYDGGNKIFADDPTAGEIRIIAPDGGTGWIFPGFGRWNIFEHTFTLTEPQTVRLGVGARSRFGLANNGWVFDNWDLQKAEGG